MGLLGTVTQAGKLLKVPRIYNALITSDEKLLPSQAYPALAPIVQSIQYPLPGYVTTGLYQTVLPYGSSTAGRSFSYAVKQDYYSYNYVENDIPIASVVPKIDQTTLFTPAGTQNIPKEVPYGATKLPNYQFHGQLGGDFQDLAKAPANNLNFTYSASFQETIPAKPTDAGRFKNSQLPEPSAGQPQEDIPAPEEGDEKPDFEGKDYLPVDNFVKNNRPKDPSIVDIPPPPLPVGKPTGKPSIDKKKPDEYPPPPLGYIF